MRVIIDMEFETADYGGKEFKTEIEKLVKDIDIVTRLTKFKMYNKYGGWDKERDIDWEEAI